MTSPMIECACGSDATHQIGVVMHDRGCEDSTPETRCLWSTLGLTHVVEMGADQVSFAARVASIPFQCSARRDCLHVILACEECSRLSSIDYSQHKGGTYVTASIEPDLAGEMGLRAPRGGGDA